MGAGTDLEESLGRGAAGVNNTLRDTLTVKLSKLLDQMVVIKQSRASARSRNERRA